MSDLTAWENVGDKRAYFSVAARNEFAPDDADAESTSAFTTLLFRIERQQDFVGGQTRLKLLLLLLQLLIGGGGGGVGRRDGNQVSRGRRAMRKETCGGGTN